MAGTFAVVVAGFDHSLFRLGWSSFHLPVPLGAKIKNHLAYLVISGILTRCMNSSVPHAAGSSLRSAEFIPLLTKRIEIRSTTEAPRSTCSQREPEASSNTFYRQSVDRLSNYRRDGMVVIRTVRYVHYHPHKKFSSPNVPGCLPRISGFRVPSRFYQF